MIHLVLTLIGPDRPGLVGSVAEIIASHGGNWLESRMTRLGGQFAGILRAEVPEAQAPAAMRALAGLESGGLRVVAQTEAARAGDVERRLQMHLEIMGVDRPGIVREVSQLLAQAGINVDELETETYSAPMSGETLFDARATVHVPPNADLAAVRAALERAARDLTVDIRLDAAPSDGPVSSKRDRAGAASARIGRRGE